MIFMKTHISHESTHNICLHFCFANQILLKPNLSSQRKDPNAGYLFTESTISFHSIYWKKSPSLRCDSWLKTKKKIKKKNSANIIYSGKWMWNGCDWIFWVDFSMIIASLMTTQWQKKSLWINIFDCSHE